MPSGHVGDLLQRAENEFDPIAAVAIAEDLPLFTTNPADFVGLSHLLTVVPVARPETAWQP